MKKNRKKTSVIIAIILALVVGCAFLSPPGRRQIALLREYSRGVSLLQAGDYQTASEVFLSLGNYRDAPAQAEQAARGMEYSAALALAEKGEYARAASAFDALGDFPDAGEQAALCRDRLAHIEFDRAVQDEDYRRALEILDSGDGHWDNAEALRAEYGARALCADAAEDLSAGRNYSAWKKYSSLGDWPDAQALAAMCVLDRPADGELYRNAEYKGKSVAVKFKTPDDGSSTYLKLYSVGSDTAETLVSTVFISADKTVSVRIPPGVYVIKAAYSYGDWYGETEMFGDEGVYQQLIFSDGSGQMTLRANKIYTISLRSAADGNVDAIDETADNF